MRFTEQSLIQHLIDKGVFDINKFIDDYRKPIISGKMNYWTSTDGVQIQLQDDVIKLSRVLHSTVTEDEVRMSFNIKTHILTVHYENYDEYWNQVEECEEDCDGYADEDEENPFNPNQTLINYDTSDISDMSSEEEDEVSDVLPDCLAEVDKEREIIEYDFNFSTQLFTDDAKYFQYSTVHNPYISMEQGLEILDFFIDAVRIYQMRYIEFLREHDML